MEDCLKWLFKRARQNRISTVSELKPALHLTEEELKRSLEELVGRGWVVKQAGRLSLTASGTSYALRIIRAHRLAELHLADRTAVSETEWHARAEEWEHHLDPEEVEALSATLGHPTHDPHGDPIPTRTGRLFSRKGIPLPELKLNQWARIIHIEDEPEGVFERIAGENLYAGMQVRILDRSSSAIRFIAEGAVRSLDVEAASNLFVEKISREEVVDLSHTRRLSDLRAGESGKVVLVSKACRGLERRRFMDLGLLPGSTVQAAFQNPGGRTIAYEVKGTLVALRREQADQIFVEAVEESAA